MTRVDFALIALLCLLILGLALCARAGDLNAPKQAYLVCEGRCLQGVSLGPKAQLITPMIDGKPDRAHAVIKGIIADYDPNLEKVDIR